MSRSVASTRRGVLGATLATVASSCIPPRPSWTLNYNITVRVRAGRRSFEGSSTFKTIYHQVDGMQRFFAEAWGEAIPIDIGGGDYLFAILDNVLGVTTDHIFSPLHLRLAIDLLPENLSASRFASGEGYALASELKGEHYLAPNAWPLLVHFNDLRNLATAQYVPTPRRDYQRTPPIVIRPLASLCGLGAEVQGVSFEISRDRVDDRIEELLPWVAEMQGSPRRPRIRGAVASPLSDNLQYANFKKNGDAR